MLLIIAIQQKCKVVDLGIGKDTEGSLVEHMDAALCSDADIILTSDGVSMVIEILSNLAWQRYVKFTLKRLPTNPSGLLCTNYKDVDKQHQPYDCILFLYVVG